MNKETINVRSILIKHKPLLIDKIFNKCLVEYDSFDEEEYYNEEQLYMLKLMESCLKGDGSNYKPKSKSKKKKKKKFKNYKSWKRYSKDSDIYDSYDMFPKDESDYNGSYKEIYYYDDVYESSKFNKFNNLSDFDAYLTSQGIELSDDDIEYILNNDIIYTCLDIYKFYHDHKYNLILSDTYGELRFSYIESEEKCSNNL